MSDIPAAAQEKEELWKYRAPYQVQKDHEFGSVKWRGKCHCGRVQYQLKRENPLAAKFCHCRACQVLHGAPFQWCAIFPKTDMCFSRGIESLKFYSSHSMTLGYQLPCKVYCSYCNTPIMDEGRNMCLIFPELIEISPEEGEHKRRRDVFDVDCHIFYSRRILDVLDGKPKWSGLDGKSNQLDDHGRAMES